MVDSGPLVALFNTADRWHRTIVSWLDAHRRIQLITTWPVLTEVCALLAQRLSNDAALDFLRWLQRGAVDLDRPEAGSLTDVLSISERFADLPFDLADASIAEAAARLKIRSVLSIDADFDVYRDKTRRPLRNLLTTGAPRR
jgi:hypothetical protein